MELIRRSFTNCKRCLKIAPIRNYSSKLKEAKEDWPRRIVSGMQPTGVLHVGNFFGALQRCVQLQDAGDDVMLFIADLHSLTVQQNPEALQNNILDLTALILASGMDPNKSTIFVQSKVPRHAELCWMLACLATNARLAHLPQYKEKSANMKEVPIGLMMYPVLQAADILIYRGTHVPVGVDQLQHLQVATQLVKTFKHRYGSAFPSPQPLLPQNGFDRLRSLRDPTKKMSKSDNDPKSRILLTDSDDNIKLKIRKAVTDFTPQVTYDPEHRPGVSNLVMLHCLATDSMPEEVVEEAEGLTTAQYKTVVSKALCEFLSPIRSRAESLRSRPQLLRDTLRHGATRARQRADECFEQVLRLQGLADDGDVIRRVVAKA